MPWSGVWMPPIITQGATKSAPNFQIKVEPCLAELRKHLVACFNDFLVHAQTEKALLLVLQRFRHFSLTLSQTFCSQMWGFQAKGKVMQSYDKCSRDPGRPYEAEWHAESHNTGNCWRTLSIHPLPTVDVSRNDRPCCTG